MFLKNSRIERKDGIRFYEQDILFNEYLFTNDIIVDLTIDYLTPGAGIVLLEGDGELRNTSKVFLFKIGHNDFTVYRREYGKQTIDMHVSANITPPYTNLNLVFHKRGRSIELYHKDRLIGNYMLPEEMSQYKVGFYSNAGNVFKTASYAADIPKEWTVNIHNTNGGRIQFFRDGFRIENCERDAEVEQNKVFIPKGKYFLVYETELVNEENDINSFVFLTSDERFDDKEKSILLEDGSFEIEEDSYINVKFKGTSGIIRNISIKDNLKDGYVSTDEVASISDGSVMVINLEGLKEIKWKGIINGLPEYDDLFDERSFAVIATQEKKYYPVDLNVETENEYQYTLDVETMTLTILDEEENEIASEVIELTEEDENKLSVFYNITGVIYEIIVTKTTGEVIDVLLQKTQKFYVPNVIKSPIAVTDEYYVPLDLSSSYRAIKNKNGEILYEFTNWEREIFEPDTYIVTEKAIEETSGSVKIYGILDMSKTDMKNFYSIKESIDSIDLFAEQYDIITEENYEVNYGAGEIRIEEEIVEQYEAFVIDYLKKDSYCINYREDLRSYEVDVSTGKDTIVVMYDFEGDDTQGTVNEYKITDIPIDGSKGKYIVLRK